MFLLWINELVITSFKYIYNRNLYGSSQCPIERKDLLIFFLFILFFCNNDIIKSDDGSTLKGEVYEPLLIV